MTTEVTAEVPARYRIGPNQPRQKWRKVDESYKFFDLWKDDVTGAVEIRVNYHGLKEISVLPLDVALVLATEINLAVQRQAVDHSPKQA